MGDFPKSEMTLEDLTSMMAGGTELDSLVTELEQTMGKESPVVADMAADAGHGQ